MEYQKLIHLLDDTTNQPSKFTIRNWAEINDESWKAYNDDDDDNNNNDDDDNSNNIKFKT